MTVATRTIEDRRDLWRHLRPRIDGLRFVDRRIRKRGPNGLHANENNDEDDQNYLQDFLDHRIGR